MNMYQCPATLVLLSENQFMSGLTLCSYTFLLCNGTNLVTIHGYMYILESDLSGYVKLAVVETNHSGMR